MLTDDQVTALQLALEQRDFPQIQTLLQSASGDELTGLSIFAEHTVLMYACEKATPEIVEFLIQKGTQVEELEWSTNNELKATLKNKDFRNAILPIILKEIPSEIVQEMIQTDWDPEGFAQGRARSPLDMARELEDKTCCELLKKSL